MEGRMNQAKTAFQFSKEIILEIFCRFRYVISNTRASLDLSDSVFAEKFDKAAEVVIGKTTYLVSSFFKKNAKGNVVDKISRMIERDVSMTAEREKVTNTTGSSSRFML